MEKYIALKKNDAATHLKISLYYNKGGYNVFTYKEEQRGYYLCVAPVSREDRNGYIMESAVAFSGIKKCILPVSRKSAKAERIAESDAATHEKELIRYVCAKNGLEIEEGDQNDTTH